MSLRGAVWRTDKGGGGGGIIYTVKFISAIKPAFWILPENNVCCTAFLFTKERDLEFNFYKFKGTVSH
jgi:hypothetical protein